MKEETENKTVVLDPSNEGTQQPKEEAGNLIVEANKAAERLENANKDLAKLIAIQQKAQVEKTLSGNTQAGNTETQITEEDKKTANAKKFLEGTGYDVDLFGE